MDRPPSPNSDPASPPERLARLQGRHQIPWLAGRSASAGLVGLLMLLPGLFFVFVELLGTHSSPLYTSGGGWILGAFWALALVGVVLVSRRSGHTKLWRAPRRRPWWSASLRAGPPRSCAYCHDDLSGGNQELSCPGCGGAYHSECLAELGRCASLGCAGLGEVGPARRVALSAPKLEGA